MEKEIREVYEIGSKAIGEVHKTKDTVRGRGSYQDLRILSNFEGREWTAMKTVYLPDLLEPLGLTILRAVLVKEVADES